ncbi:MAG: excinuclease ABC subunit UvrA [Thermaerobacter sp.]|nr:excinuclease ABC subunit UvrA [Thermaerobacter sp.]
MSGEIVVRGARQHNLKNIDLRIPRDKLVVVTGLSGSGKSSFAFDTLYAEGQRRYVESLSAYARQFLGQMDKPDVDAIEGLSPAISIDQKTTSRNPRSTVGTVTEIYDYLRLLYARIGHPHCPTCGRPIEQQTVEQMVDQVLAYPEGTRVQILAPLVRGRKGEHEKALQDARREGFSRVRVDGHVRELSEEIALEKNKKHTIEAVVDRIVMRDGIRERLADSFETALRLGEGLAVALRDDREDVLFSQNFACPNCGESLAELSPRMFSFNNPYGACPACSGLGFHLEPDEDLIVPDARRSLRDGAIAPWATSEYYGQLVLAAAQAIGADPDTPFGELSDVQRDALLAGIAEPVPFGYVGAYGRRSGRTHFVGAIEYVARRHRDASSDVQRQELEAYMSPVACSTCKGRRLRREILAVTVGERSIADLTAMAVRDALPFLKELKLREMEQLIARDVLREIAERLGFLESVGLEYLTLDRAAATLSGGEAQRIRLATQIGSGLVGVIYILDEPSIGLHPRDNDRLLATLCRLRDLGNTVLVVEHDEETWRAADWLIDFGPGAGEHGGRVIAEGTLEEIERNEESLTGQYLSGRRSIPVPDVRRPIGERMLHLHGAQGNNLKNLDVELPLGVFIAVTGVSGSGKSTLVNDILYRALAMELNGARRRPLAYRGIDGLEHLDKVVDVDQDPIGRTPRSNPATYTGLFDLVREVFAQTPEARMRGYKAGRFSFNVRGGRCEACHGDGILRIEMHFLPDVYVPCESCKGKRYNRETLDVRFKGKTISDVLEMTVDEAVGFFQSQPRIRRKLETLSQVGLGYIRLGQPATTLSGGEAQRVKLATELSRRQDGRTFYILDEPTTGLHPADVERLLEVLHRLVDSGNTVLVIEHNLDVIKTADYIIDLGPEGGEAGGEIIAQGRPEEIAAMKQSYTGRFLQDTLHRRSLAGD